MQRTDALHELVRLRSIFADMTAGPRARGPGLLVGHGEDEYTRLVEEAIQRAGGDFLGGVQENLTTRELAAKWRKSEWTIRDYAKRGRIPGARKVGRDWLFPRCTELVAPPDTSGEGSTEELVVAIDAYLESL